MIQVQVRDFAGQVGGVREARALIFGGVAGNGAGLLDGGTHRGGAQIRGTRRTLALSEIDRETQAAIALVFDGVHFPQAYGGGEPALQAGVGLALRGPGAPGFGHDLLDDLCKLRDPGGVDFLLHMSCRCVGAEL